MNVRNGLLGQLTFRPLGQRGGMYLCLFVPAAHALNIARRLFGMNGRSTALSDSYKCDDTYRFIAAAVPVLIDVEREMNPCRRIASCSCFNVASSPCSSISSIRARDRSPADSASSSR